MRKLKHLPIEQWPVDDVLWSFLMPFRVTNRSNPQLDRWLRSTTEVSAEQHREAWGTGSVAPASEESAGPKHRPHLQEERDLCEGHALEEPGRVFLIAANAIKSFVVSRQGLPEGPAMPFWFSFLAIARGLNPAEKSRKMAWPRTLKPQKPSKTFRSRLLRKGACSAARGSGTCSNRQSIRRGALEALILDGLRQRLMAPELVEEFIRAFQREVNLQRREDDALREVQKRELATVKRKLDGLVEAIADGLRAPGLQQRLDELEARRKEIEEGLATAPMTPVRLHPNLAHVYRQKVERLQRALEDSEIRDEAVHILRGLIEYVSIGPTENGLEIEIVGEIAKMVELGIRTNAKQANLDERLTRSVKVVAGVGFEPTTFRL